MDFYEVLDQVIDLLQHRERVTYRALKLQFQLDDEHLEALSRPRFAARRRAARRCDRQPLGAGAAAITASEGRPPAEARGAGGGAKMAFECPILTGLLGLGRVKKGDSRKQLRHSVSVPSSACF
jgi:hypothetical protein